MDELVAEAQGASAEDTATALDREQRAREREEQRVLQLMEELQDKVSSVVLAIIPNARVTFLLACRMRNFPSCAGPRLPRCSSWRASFGPVPTRWT